VTNVQVVDASRYPARNNGQLAPMYWGIWGLILVETIVFGSLVASYFYLRLISPAWPPAGVKPPDLVLPTVSTAVILLSVYFVRRADKGIEEGKVGRLKFGLALSVLLGAAFLTIKYVEYSDLAYRWDSHAYGSIVWTIVGFHTAHVIALLLKTAVVLTLAFLGYWSRERNLGVQVNGIYWTFVVAIWVPLYGVLYLAPRWLD
jgi:cytochrome c oxidase subunit III